MSKEVMDRIFDPFFTTKEIGKGTGLGLSTAMIIVKGHKGFVNVYSEPRKGTRFAIYLPAAASETESESKSAASDIPHGNGETILVVDDEAMIREIAQATLERFGYKVLTAANGKEALQVIADAGQTISLVVTDLAMPEMDGQALVQHLRENSSEILVVAMSGLVGPEQAAEMRAIGVDTILNKPFSAMALLTEIRNSLKK
jgi:CheY-like chemotaxis protein